MLAGKLSPIAAYDHAMHLELVSVIVDDYDPAIDFFVDRLGFELVEDSPATTTVEGRPKRWVVVRPPGAVPGLLLARADGDHQRAAIGEQFAAASASSCASTTSTRRTSACCRPASSS